MSMDAISILGAARKMMEESLVGAGAIKGQDGANGKSAYDIALSRGFVGTEEEWLESLKGATGADGLPGPDGKSAYQEWLDLGNTGTEEEFLESLKGDGADIEVDETLNKDSENPIQNKAVAAKFEEVDERLEELGSTTPVTDVKHWLKFKGTVGGAYYATGFSEFEINTVLNGGTESLYGDWTLDSIESDIDPKKAYAEWKISTDSTHTITPDTLSLTSLFDIYSSGTAEGTEYEIYVEWTAVDFDNKKTYMSFEELNIIKGTTFNSYSDFDAIADALEVGETLICTNGYNFTKFEMIKTPNGTHLTVYDNKYVKTATKTDGELFGNLKGLEIDLVLTEYSNNAARSGDVFYRFSQVDESLNEIDNKVGGVNDRVDEITETLVEMPTKEYVAEQISSSTHLNKEIVATPPLPEDAKENIIYMVKDETVVGDDKYIEYMLINGEIVPIGNTSMDVTNFATKEELDKKAEINDTVITTLRTFSSSRIAELVSDMLSDYNKIYRRLYELGLDEDATIDDVVSAMRLGSICMLPSDAFRNREPFLNNSACEMVLFKEREYKLLGILVDMNTGDLCTATWEYVSSNMTRRFVKWVPQGGVDNEELEKYLKVIESTLGYACKNLIPSPYGTSPSESRGITFTPNADGTVGFSGIANDPTAAFYTFPTVMYLPAGSYKVTSGNDIYGGAGLLLYDDKGCTTVYSGGYEGLLSIGSAVYVYDTLDGTVNWSVDNTYGYEKEFTIEKPAYAKIQARSVNNTYTEEVNGIIYPMVRLASIEDVTWEQYKPSVDERFNNLSVSGSVKHYSSLAELGLTAPTTVGEVFVTMPDKSILMLNCETFDGSSGNTPTVTDIPKEFGVLTIEKFNYGRHRIEYSSSLGGSASDVRKWIGSIKGNTGENLTWKELTTSRAYVALADLGLTADATLDDVIAKLETGQSATLRTTEFTNYQTLFPYKEEQDANATVRIDKGYDKSRTIVTWVRKDASRVAYGGMGGDNTILWWYEHEPLKEILHTSLSGNLAGITTVLDLVNALLTEYRALSPKKPVRFVSGEISKTTLTDLPVTYGVLQITVAGWDVVEVRLAHSANGFKSMYYGFLTRITGEESISSITWEKVATTGYVDSKVGTDVALTTLTPSSGITAPTGLTMGDSSKVAYCVKNGVCYVHIALQISSITDKVNSWVKIATLPKSMLERLGAMKGEYNSVSANMPIKVNTDGTLSILYRGETSSTLDWWGYSFSYPVAE